MADTRDLGTLAKDMVEYYVGKQMPAAAIAVCLARIAKENPPLYKRLVVELRQIRKAS